MSKLGEMSKLAQLGIVLVLLLAASAVFVFLMDKPVYEQNKADLVKLKAKQGEVANLQRYEKDMPELERQIQYIQQQLEIQKKIVPDEAEADQFMHMLQNTAASAGIEVRKYKAEKIKNADFYTEVPFNLELDGPYYSMLTFFDKVAKLDRIIKVTNLQVSALKPPGKYQYSPTETVSATCVASTFFSHDVVAKPVAPVKNK